MRQAPVIAARAQPGAAAARRPALPPGACDCHVHLFGAPGRYPLAARRAYTPGLAEVADAEALLRVLGLARLVLVQPSAYGTDNACLLDGLAALGGRARGIAVVARDIGDAELAELHAAGVRGLRVNLGGPEADAAGQDLGGVLESTAARLSQSGWLLQLHAPAAALVAAGEAARGLAVPLVIDHFANIPATALPDHPACTLVENLLAGGNAWLKLSAPYRVARDARGLERLRRWVDRLAARWPDRLLWGSDWPHTPPHGPQVDPARSIGFREVDAAADLATLLAWLGDADLCEKVLARNPERLLGFA